MPDPAKREGFRAAWVMSRVGAKPNSLQIAGWAFAPYKSLQKKLFYHNSFGPAGTGMSCDGFRS